MSRWFRFYDDAVNDPKLLRLPDDLYRAWTILLCFASKNGGMLPPSDDIAIALREKPAKVCEWITKLVRGGLMDQTPTGFVPHNWGVRQYKSDVSTDRVKRFRNANRNVSETPSETVCSVSVSVPSKTLSKKEVSSDFEFEDFWNVWPNKVGKPAALKAFVGARKRADLDAIVAGVFSYIRDKPPDRPWLNPATFLNQNRWEDQPAQVANGRNEKAESLSHVARRLAESGVAFGERPSTPSVCDIEGRVDVRLLPQGGSERPGDLRSGDGGGIERISARGD